MPGTTFSIDAAELSALRDQVARLDALARRRGRQLHALLVAGASLLALGVCFGTGFTQVRHQLSSCRARLLESRQESSAVASTDGGTRHASTSSPAGELDVTAHGRHEAMQCGGQQRRVVVTRQGTRV
jgi:hypothetical protein